MKMKERGWERGTAGGGSGGEWKWVELNIFRVIAFKMDLMSVQRASNPR